MPNYQNGKIYRLYSLEGDVQYIGSTTQLLSQRLGGHIRDYKKYKLDKKKYITSFKVLEYSDYKIELIVH